MAHVRPPTNRPWGRLPITGPRSCQVQGFRCQMGSILAILGIPSVAQPRPASGSLPGPRPASGSLAQPRPASGSLAQPRPASGSLPQPRPASGSVPKPPLKYCSIEKYFRLWKRENQVQFLYRIE
jgi:hypothetical protein